MKFAVLFIFGLFFMGCGASAIRDMAENAAADSVCTPACSAQVEFDNLTCEKVCVEVADTGRKVLKDPTLDGIFDVACDVACAKQAVVPAAVCLPICNFLANSGKSVLNK